MQIQSLQGQVSAEEWQLRVDLAACYRLVALYGWTDLVFTHLSANIPGPERHFLINHYGLMFDEITASSLVKVDQDCNKLSDSPLPVNPAGFTIHSAIHEARQDVQGVLHSHIRAGAAVSTQRSWGVWRLNSGGRGLVESTKKAVQVQTNSNPGQFVWPALIRKLNRVVTDYTS